MKTAAARRRLVAARLPRLRRLGAGEAASCTAAPVLMARLLAEFRLVVDLVSDALQPGFQRPTVSGQVLAEPSGEDVNVGRAQGRQLLVPRVAVGEDLHEHLELWIAGQLGIFQ